MRISDWSSDVCSSDLIEAADFAEVQADEDLMRIVRQSGQTLFRDNCSVCHGIDARGGPGYPNLVAGAWLWGGDPQTIAETLRVGINADHPETRFSEMAAFGRDQMLDRQAIQDVVAYVRSLSDPSVAEGGKDRRSVVWGKRVAVGVD